MGCQTKYLIICSPSLSLFAFLNLITFLIEKRNSYCKEIAPQYLLFESVLSFQESWHWNSSIPEFSLFKLLKNAYLFFLKIKKLPVYFLLSFHSFPSSCRKAKREKNRLLATFFGFIIHRSAYKDAPMLFLIYLSPQTILTTLKVWLNSEVKHFLVLGCRYFFWTFKWCLWQRIVISVVPFKMTLSVNIPWLHWELSSLWIHISIL